MEDENAGIIQRVHEGVALVDPFALDPDHREVRGSHRLNDVEVRFQAVTALQQLQSTPLSAHLASQAHEIFVTGKKTGFIR